MDINELIKKYPVNDVGEESDPRDYDIDMLECASNVTYDDIVKNVDYPIRHQGSISSCTPHAITLLGSYSKNTQPKTDEMFSVGWIFGNRENTDTSVRGMAIRDGFNVACKIGFVKNKDFPFNLPYEDCITKIKEYGRGQLLEKASKYKMSAYVSLYDEDDVKKFLHETDGLVVLSVKVYKNFYDSLTNGGVIPKYGEGDRVGSHAMVIKGVKDGKYVIVNSWGEYVGDKGIFYLDVKSPLINGMKAFVDKRLLREPPVYNIGWEKIPPKTPAEKLKWKYRKADGTYCKDEWLQLGKDWFYFGSDCVAYSERWLSWKNDWYFFNLDCYMETSKWVYWKDKWYYLGSYGAMLTNCITPDGYRVDKNGVWIK